MNGTNMLSSSPFFRIFRINQSISLLLELLTVTKTANIMTTSKPADNGYESPTSPLTSLEPLSRDDNPMIGGPTQEVMSSSPTSEPREELPMIGGPTQDLTSPVASAPATVRKPVVVVKKTPIGKTSTGKDLFDTIELMKGLKRVEVKQSEGSQTAAGGSEKSGDLGDSVLVTSDKWTKIQGKRITAPKEQSTITPTKALTFGEKKLAAMKKNLTAVQYRTTPQQGIALDPQLSGDEDGNKGKKGKGKKKKLCISGEEEKGHGMLWSQLEALQYLWKKRCAPAAKKKKAPCLPPVQDAQGPVAGAAVTGKKKASLAKTKKTTGNCSAPVEKAAGSVGQPGGPGGKDIPKKSLAPQPDLPGSADLASKDTAQVGEHAEEPCLATVNKRLDVDGGRDTLDRTRTGVAVGESGAPAKTRISKGPPDDVGQSTHLASQLAVPAVPLSQPALEKFTGVGLDNSTQDGLDTVGWSAGVSVGLAGMVGNNAAMVDRPDQPEPSMDLEDFTATQDGLLRMLSGLETLTPLPANQLHARAAEAASGDDVQDQFPDQDGGDPLGPSWSKRVEQALARKRAQEYCALAKAEQEEQEVQNQKAWRMMVDRYLGIRPVGEESGPGVEFLVGSVPPLDNDQILVLQEVRSWDKINGLELGFMWWEWEGGMDDDLMRPVPTWLIKDGVEVKCFIDDAAHERLARFMGNQPWDFYQLPICYGLAFASRDEWEKAVKNDTLLQPDSPIPDEDIETTATASPDTAVANGSLTLNELYQKIFNPTKGRDVHRFRYESSGPGTPCRRDDGLTSLEDLKLLLGIWSRTKFGLKIDLKMLKDKGLHTASPKLFAENLKRLDDISTYIDDLKAQIRDCEANKTTTVKKVVDLKRAEVLQPTKRKHVDVEVQDVTAPPKKKTKAAPAVVVQTADPPLKKKTKAPSEVATPKVAAAAKKKTTKAPGGSEPKKLASKKTNGRAGGLESVTSNGASSQHVPDEVTIPTESNDMLIDKGPLHDGYIAPSSAMRSGPSLSTIVSRSSGKPTSGPPKPTPQNQKKLKDMNDEEKALHKAELADKKKNTPTTEFMSVPCVGSLMQVSWPRERVMAQLDAHRNMEMSARNTKWDYGPELGKLVHQMIKWSQKDMHDPRHYTRPDLFKVPKEVIAKLDPIHLKVFRNNLIFCPGLVQIDAEDPFWKKEVVKLDMIADAATAYESDKAASWKALFMMMVRVDDEPTYVEDKDLANITKGAMRKIHNLAEKCLNHFHHYVKPDAPPAQDSPAFVQDSLLSAGKFLIGKIKALDTGARTNGATLNTGDCLMLLQMKIWETLLACLMMQQSKFSETLKDYIAKGLYKEWALTQASKMNEYDRGQSLYQDGASVGEKTAAATKEWGKERLSAFGSMAIFFLHGAAGWWISLVDSHHYNQKDVWTLTHMAHARHEHLYSRGHLSQRRKEHTPWYNVDSFVRWLLVEGGMLAECPSKVDWNLAPVVWAKYVTEANIARLALSDILDEVLLDIPRKVMNFKAEVAPQVKFKTEEEQALVDSFKSQFKAPYATLGSNYRNAVRLLPAPVDDGHTEPSTLVNPETQPRALSRINSVDRLEELPPSRLLSRVNSPFSAAQVTPTPAPKSKLPTVPQSEADLSNNPKVPSKAKDLALPAPSAEGDEDEEEGSEEEEDGSEEEEDGSEMEEELMSEEDPNRSETDEEEEERALRSKENPYVDVSARVPRKKK
ncbi:Golgi to ER traffic- protein [Puccinia graminis f. sp. tritici]|uniref:Golgi to ER traffic-protein n=1 Tax=Puccinia graminis f. sp. tritici TaxID=56615 RepID=A0A5B0PBN9_PUCGR|nr:Golgi to ER traffic- protein [Puccinia graminis f. sp. tritici]